MERITAHVASYGDGDFVGQIVQEYTSIELTVIRKTPIAAARAAARKLRALANQLDRQADRGFKGKWGRVRP